MRASVFFALLLGAAAAAKIGIPGSAMVRAAAAPVLTAVNPSLASGGAKLADLGDVVDAIRTSRTVTLSAYTLSRRSRVTRALIAAVNGGASAHLVLDGKGMAGAVRGNRTLAADLCDATHGAIAQSAAGPRLLPLCQGRLRIDLTRFPLHMKAAIADGVVYLSDRNWTTSRRSVILRVKSSARFTVERAILGSAGTSGSLTTRKADSLAAEAALLARRRSHIVLLETESFGRGAIATQLANRARAGDGVTLVVARMEYQRSGAERALVSELVRDGVHAYTGTSDEKIAVDGDAVWLGSSNATSGVPEQIDWGFATIDGALARELARHVRDDAAAGENVR